MVCPNCNGTDDHANRPPSSAARPTRVCRHSSFVTRSCRAGGIRLKRCWGIRLADNGSGASYTLVAAVTGAGTLDAAANGDAIGSVTAASSPATLSFSSALASNALAFDFAGGGTASLSAFTHEAPTVMIVR